MATCNIQKGEKKHNYFASTVIVIIIKKLIKLKFVN